jgi:hypothetical protein
VANSKSRIDAANVPWIPFHHGHFLLSSFCCKLEHVVEDSLLGSVLMVMCLRPGFSPGTVLAVLGRSTFVGTQGAEIPCFFEWGRRQSTQQFHIQLTGIVQRLLQCPIDAID